MELTEEMKRVLILMGLTWKVKVKIGDFGAAAEVILKPPEGDTPSVDPVKIGTLRALNLRGLIAWRYDWPTGEYVLTPEGTRTAIGLIPE